MEFKCCICNKEFYKKRYLKAHEVRLHGKDESAKQNEVMSESFPCKNCSETFGSRSALWRHNNRVHKRKRTGHVFCKETGCSEKFLNVCDLRAHLNSIHNLEGYSDCTNLQFKSESDFFEWLADEEKKTSSKFVLSNGKQKNKDFTYHMFICNRSGVFKAKDERNRQLKAQGTRKIGHHCTSCIIMRNYGTHLTAVYYSQHYNHDSLLCHIPLPDTEKEVIAASLNSSGSVKGKITKKATENFKRHKEGKDFKGTLQKIGEKQWKVLSSEKEYIVTKLHDCKNECIIACRNCYLCFKSFICNCHDYMISNFLCKHIHYVAISLSKELGGQELPFMEPLNPLNLQSRVFEETSEPKQNYVEVIKTELMSLTSQFSNVDELDKNVYLQISQHVKAIKHLVALKSNNIVEETKKSSQPTNKKIICQKRFYSVKKSRSKAKLKFSKPTQTKVEAKKRILLQKELLKSSNANFDHNY